MSLCKAEIKIGFSECLIIYLLKQKPFGWTKYLDSVNYARHCPEYITYINSCSPLNNPIREILLLWPFYRQGN